MRLHFIRARPWKHCLLFRIELPQRALRETPLASCFFHKVNIGKIVGAWQIEVAVHIFRGVVQLIFGSNGFSVNFWVYHIVAGPWLHQLLLNECQSLSLSSCSRGVPSLLDWPFKSSYYLVFAWPGRLIIHLLGFHYEPQPLRWQMFDETAFRVVRSRPRYVGFCFD